MLASLIGGFISGEAMNTVRRMKSAAIAYVFVAIFAVTGIGFLVGAGYIAAARKYGSFEAAIAFGVGFIVIAILIFAIQSIAAARARRRRKQRGIDLATIAGAAAVTGLPILLRSRTGLHRATYRHRGLRDLPGKPQAKAGRS